MPGFQQLEALDVFKAAPGITMELNSYVLGDTGMPNHCQSTIGI